MSKDKKYEIFCESDGNTLLQAFTFFDLETILHADEKAAERINDTGKNSKKSRKLWEGLWVANGALYLPKEGDIEVSLVRGRHNLLFKHIRDGWNVINKHFQYFAINKGGNIDALTLSRYADSTISATYSELGIKCFGYGEIASGFKINTLRYERSSESKLRFLEGIYGQGEALERYMKCLYDRGIHETNVQVIPRKEVKQMLQSEAAIVSACALDSDFIMDDTRVTMPVVGNSNKFTRAFETLLENPEETVHTMHPCYLRGMLNLLAVQKETYTNAAKRGFSVPYKVP